MPADSIHAREWNFDGLVGPTHNFAGLSPGNLASTKNAAAVSHPKAAALQGLAKMKLLHDLGVPQAVLPPHPRPDPDWLRRVGFSGADSDVIRAAAKHDPRLLAAAYSSSFMWTANAATVSPSADCSDGRVHFTPANLITQTHRSIEPAYTAKLLRAVFRDDKLFAHHDPLPGTGAFADEGAANHLRLAAAHDEAGVELFVDGRGHGGAATKFPARQGPATADAIRRLHGIADDRFLSVRQSPEAIDGGAFHNDVVAASNRNVLLVHPQAWVDTHAVVNRLRADFSRVSEGDVLRAFLPTPEEVSLADAVSTYLFNSQIVDLPDGQMAMIAPVECRDHPGVRRFLDRVIAARCGVDRIEFVDLRQSMSNGGGPACLRLRVVLTAAEAAGVHRGVVFDDRLLAALTGVIERTYRDDLSPADLADPEFAVEATAAVAAMYGVMGLAIAESVPNM
jgi:succinylarginine dihydrolase